MPKRRIIEDDEEDNEAHRDNDSDLDEDEVIILDISKTK